MHKTARSDYEELMATLWGAAPAEEQPETPKQDSLKIQQVNIPGFVRMRSANKELQNISQQILNAHRNKPLYTKIPFTSSNKKYVAVLEPHPPNVRNPEPHVGVSLFEETQSSTQNVGTEHISNLDYNIQPLANKFIELASMHGIPVAITSGYRSNTDQERLYQQGRTTKGPVVTNAKPGQSKHNYGVAFDVAPLDEQGNIYWAKDRPEVWEKLGQIGESLGLKWGGRFKSIKDRPHFELPVSVEDLKSGKFPTRYSETKYRIAQFQNLLKKTSCRFSDE